MSHLQTFGRILAANICLLLITGCGSDGIPTYPVKGTVKLEDGAPVRAGQIEFYNAENDLTATGSIDKDGTFEMGTFEPGDGAVEGEHQVIITQLIMRGQMGVPQVDHGSHISPDYADFNSSGLSWTVERNSTKEAEFVVRARESR